MVRSRGWRRMRYPPMIRARVGAGVWDNWKFGDLASFVLSPKRAARTPEALSAVCARGVRGLYHSSLEHVFVFAARTPNALTPHM